MICVLGTLYPFQSTTNWPSSLPASSRSDMWKLIRTHLKLSKSFKEINEWSPVNSPAHIHCTGAWQDALRNRIVFTMHWIKIILNDWATSVNFARSSGRGEWPFNLSFLYLKDHGFKSENQKSIPEIWCCSLIN